jgi:hypothetical protein
MMLKRPGFFSTALQIGLLLALAGPASAQNTNLTAGTCSPIVTQNRGPVTIECSGVSEQMQRQLVEVLNSILQKQLDPAAVMSKLDEIAKGMGDLKKKSIDAERGIVSTYDFNGAKRDQVGGRITVEAGAQVNAFQKMLTLLNAQLWQELAALCEEQIVAAPRWLTPYYFAGYAYGNLGDRDRALDRLEHVAAFAGSDPSYSKAGALIRELKSHP